MAGHRILSDLPHPLPPLLMYIYACSFSIFLGCSSGSGKLISELGSLLGSNGFIHVCHIVCSHPPYILNGRECAWPLSSEVQGGSGPGHRKAPGLRGRPTRALPDLIQDLERDAKNHARNSLKSPVLRPGRPGSVTVTYLGVEHMLLCQELRQPL